MRYDEKLARWEYIGEEDLLKWLDPTITMIRVVASPNPFNDEENTPAWTCVRQDLLADARYSMLFRMHLRKEPELYSGVNWHRTVVHPGVGRFVQMALLGQSAGGMERYLRRYLSDQIWANTPRADLVLNRVVQLGRYLMVQPKLLATIAQWAPDIRTFGWTDLVLKYEPASCDETWPSYLALHDVAADTVRFHTVLNTPLTTEEMEQAKTAGLKTKQTTHPVVNFNYDDQAMRLIKKYVRTVPNEEARLKDCYRVDEHGVVVPRTPTGRVPTEPAMQDLPRKKESQLERTPLNYPLSEHFRLLKKAWQQDPKLQLHDLSADSRWKLTSVRYLHDTEGHEYICRFELYHVGECSGTLTTGERCTSTSEIAELSYRHGVLRYTHWCAGDRCTNFASKQRHLHPTQAPKLSSAQSCAAWLAKRLLRRVLSARDETMIHD